MNNISNVEISKDVNVSSLITAVAAAFHSQWLFKTTCIDLIKRHPARCEVRWFSNKNLNISTTTYLGG